jgi:hypothetical protein
MRDHRVEVVSRLTGLGIDHYDALELRRIAMTLHRWCELECGDSDNYKSWAIERDEVTDKPYMCIYPHSDNKVRRYPVADREKGAGRRLLKIMAKYPDFVPYYQTDCRGAPLYIVKKSDIPEGASIDAYYNRGVAVYK